MNITINRVAVNDSGVYTCVYKKLAGREDKGDVYTLLVRGLFHFGFFSEFGISPDAGHPGAGSAVWERWKSGSEVSISIPVGAEQWCA